MPSTKKSDLTFEESFRKLEEIVQILESGESTLEEAIHAYEEGMELVEDCMKKLNKAEIRLKKLVKGENEEFRVEPAN